MDPFLQGTPQVGLQQRGVPQGPTPASQRPPDDRKAEQRDQGDRDRRSETGRRAATPKKLSVKEIQIKVDRLGVSSPSLQFDIGAPKRPKVVATQDRASPPPQKDTEVSFLDATAVGTGDGLEAADHDPKNLSMCVFMRTGKRGAWDEWLGTRRADLRLPRVVKSHGPSQPPHEKASGPLLPHGISFGARGEFFKSYRRECRHHLTRSVSEPTRLTQKLPKLPRSQPRSLLEVDADRTHHHDDAGDTDPSVAVPDRIVCQAASSRLRPGSPLSPESPVSPLSPFAPHDSSSKTTDEGVDLGRSTYLKCCLASPSLWPTARSDNPVKPTDGSLPPGSYRAPQNIATSRHRRRLRRRLRRDAAGVAQLGSSANVKPLQALELPPEPLLEIRPRRGDTGHNKEATGGTVDLSLGHKGIGNRFGLAVAQGLESALVPIVRLDVSDNRLAPDTVARVLRALRVGHLPSIKVIEISSNVMGMAGATELDRLAQARPRHLEALHLCGMRIGDATVAILAHNLFQCPALRRVELSRNQIGDFGCTALASALYPAETSSSSVSLLDLSWNLIKGGGGQALGEAIGRDGGTPLTSLDCSYNALGCQGAQHLAEGIRYNTQLTFLDLTCNGIGGEGTIALAGALETNEDLTTLVLDENAIGAAGARAMLRLYAGGEEDTTLSLDDCNIDVEEEVFDPNTPAGTYLLDLDNRPGDRAIADEVVRVANVTPGTDIDSAIHYPGGADARGCGTGPSVAITPTRQPVSPGREDQDLGKLLDANGKLWWPPRSGFLQLIVSSVPRRPMRCQGFSDQALNGFLAVIFTPKASQRRRETMLRLACQDMYFTSGQVRQVLGRIDSPHERLHALTVLIPRILDSERRRSMVNLTVRSDHEFTATMRGLGKSWFFTPENPTGHYVLDLADPQEREVFRRLQALANSEAEYAQHRSLHADTSMLQNWSSIRAATFQGFGGVRPELMEPVPMQGVVEFDFASVRRPPPDKPALSDTEMSRMLSDLNLYAGKQSGDFDEHPDILARRRQERRIATLKNIQGVFKQQLARKRMRDALDFESKRMAVVMLVQNIFRARRARILKQRLTDDRRRKAIRRERSIAHAKQPDDGGDAGEDDKISESGIGGGSSDSGRGRRRKSILLSADKNEKRRRSVLWELQRRGRRIAFRRVFENGLFPLREVGVGC